MRLRADDRGSVTAEFAVVLPAVVVVLLLGIVALSSAARLVRLQDAAADAARLVARGETLDHAAGAVGTAVPGSSFASAAHDDVVCVTATAPGATVPLLSLLPPLTASACALAGGL